MMSVHENYTGILYDVHEREDILVKKFVVEDTQGTFIYITFVSISYLIVWITHEKDTIFAYPRPILYYVLEW